MRIIWAAGLLALTSSPSIAEIDSGIEQMIADMTLEQKLGQMFLAGVPADGGISDAGGVFGVSAIVINLFRYIISNKKRGVKHPPDILFRSC